MIKAGFKYLWCLCVMLWAQPVLAQDNLESLFERDRNISVSERQKPEYETSGIQAGGLRIRPSLTLQTEFNDNIFALDTNEESDVIATINPSVTVETQSANHKLRANLGLERLEYFDFGNESVTNWNAGAEGTLDVRRSTYIQGGIDYKLGHETRNEAVTASGSEGPLEYETYGLSSAIVHEQGRIKLEGRAAHTDYDYKAARFNDGRVESQDFRDVEVVIFSARADYAVSPATSVFIRGEFQDDAYDTTPMATLNRDQKGYTIDVGADFDVTNAVRGQLGVGYLNRDFENPALSDIDSFRYSGRVEWFATPLITVSAEARRDVRASGLLDSPAFIENGVNFEIDYELRRNLILSAGFNLADEDYENVDRQDKRTSYDIGAEYLLNRYVAFDLSLRRYNLNSDGLNRQNDFNSTSLLFGLTLRR